MILWSGVKATYIATICHMLATMRGSYNTVLQHIPTVLESFAGFLLLGLVVSLG